MVENSRDIGETHLFSFNHFTHDWKIMGSALTGVNTDDQFSRSIALSVRGNRDAIGVPQGKGKSDRRKDPLDPGPVRVFDFRDNDWFECGRGVIGEETYSNIGAQVSMSGDGLRLVVAPSALGQTSSTGYAAPCMKARVLGESIELVSPFRSLFMATGLLFPLK
jgi:hypothetical protein